jgi:hypothetical protein
MTLLAARVFNFLSRVQSMLCRVDEVIVAHHSPNLAAPAAMRGPTALAPRALYAGE